ncbi:MAG: alpha/beta hydrolase [Pirellulaceae bacterium]
MMNDSPRLLLALLTAVFTPFTAHGQETGQIMADVVYGHKDGLALTMDVFLPVKANGAGVLFMVSGGWYSRYVPPERAQLSFAPLRKAGFTVFAVRHGSSPKYLIPEIIRDVRSATRFVRHHAAKYKVDPTRLGVYGGSAGGHLSLILGTTADRGNPASPDPVQRNSSHVSAVVAFYPPTDLRPWVTDVNSRYYRNYPALRFDAKKASDFSPVLQVTPDDAPTLLIHGDLDQLVPIDHSLNILKEFEQHKVKARLITIKDAGHGFRDKDAKTASSATVQWFLDHLAPPKPSP